MSKNKVKIKGEDPTIVLLVLLPGAKACVLCIGESGVTAMVINP